MRKLYESNPDVKALKEAVDAKEKELAEAEAARVSKIAEKDPDLKTLVDQQKALQEKTRQDAAKIEELRKQLHELQKTTREADRELKTLTNKVRAKMRAHLRDEDLKDLIEARRQKE
ncbi:MAG TPA: hypothetical protein EYP19_09665, partial [Desulfobacterales bacterium]|nr:hypothetical protein [Desulfobacterales bacterium]